MLVGMPTCPLLTNAYHADRITHYFIPAAAPPDGRWQMAGVLIVFGDSTMVVVHLLGYALQLQRLAWRCGIRDSVLLYYIIVYH